MSDEDICYLSAAQAITRFRDRSLSPVELMHAIAARSEALEPHIGAFTEAWFDDALDAARAAEKR